MTKKELEKPFYLIAKYWLGHFEGFTKISDDKDEITKLFEEKYMWKENTLGFTEESYQLLEVNAKEILNDRKYLDKVLGDEK